MFGVTDLKCFSGDVDQRKRSTERDFEDWKLRDLHVKAAAVSELIKHLMGSHKATIYQQRALHCHVW